MVPLCIGVLDCTLSTIESEVAEDLSRPTMGLHNNLPLIINMGNSIIGVAVLAMPFCFQQCGILLGMLLLLFCTWLTLLSCNLLMKAGVASRRRSYEFLAYHTHGAPGKFLAEIGLIGMQFGTLIAQMVVIGDLGPSIVSKVFGLANVHGMRTFLIVTLGLSVGLPMGLLKDLRAVSKASTVCIICYSVFVFYVIGQSLPSLVSGDWFTDVHFWRTKGLFRCLPIFSFSFGCQSQLFILYDALPEPSLKVFSSVTNSAVNLCAAVYLLMGFLGYISYHTHDIPGDIINIFPVTPATDMTKLAFVISAVSTFPVIIYPCRSSIYTLFFAKKSKPHDDLFTPNTHMPERLFKLITVGIVLSSMVLSILIPNVELVLGINGAIMGTCICYIFPALFYLKVMGNTSEDKNKAQFLLFAGITILLVSTMATLSPSERRHIHQEDLSGLLLSRETLSPIQPQVDPIAPVTPPPLVALNNEPANDGGRKEPPNPDPPDKVVEVKPRQNAGGQLGEPVAQNQAKEDGSRAKELEKEKKQDDLIAKLEQHRVEQEKLIEEQKQLIQEFKLHHQQDMKDKELNDQHPNQSKDLQPLANEQQATQQPANQQQGLPIQVNQQQGNAQEVNAPQNHLDANPQPLSEDVALQAHPTDHLLLQDSNLNRQAALLQEKLPEMKVDETLRLKRELNQTLIKEIVPGSNQVLEMNANTSFIENAVQDSPSVQKAANDNVAVAHEEKQAGPDSHLNAANIINNVQQTKIPSKNLEMRRKLRSEGNK
ncbi:hypothetical protein Btru_059966 [Bulinus truncatus]|nr:hypothetical protein Btru_059966 [Bulinus truncatus]